MRWPLKKHKANITWLKGNFSSLAAMVWFDWLAKRLQPRLENVTPLTLSLEAREKLCKALRVDSIASVQDLLNSLLLSECVYKAHDLGPQEAVKTLKAAQETFPPGLTTIQAVQCSLPHVHHRYLVATSPETVYVSFIGTKLAKDVLVDANFLHSPLWQASEPDTGLPAAHRGFLNRARRVPVEQLLARAQKKNKKLLFCGHSLGGAIAILCTLRVLQQASDEGTAHPPIRCITFGTPAIGNSALAARVQQQGWKDCFQNVILPEDLVPRLLALNPDASSPELSIAAPTTLSPESQQGAASRRWPNPGFASRMAPFRRPQGATQEMPAAAACAASPQTPSTVPRLILSPGGELPRSADAFEGRGTPLAGDSAQGRSWTLPRRLWRQSNGPTQDFNLLPLRVSETASTAAAEQQPEALPAAAGSGLGIAGAFHAVGRRLPLQGWWGPGVSDEIDNASSSFATAEEDGAVEALVKGPNPMDGGSQTPEKSAARRMTWLARLAQLQSLAASAASSVGGVSQLLPTYVHFGQTVIWAAVENASELPVAFPTNDMRSRVLANHRMPAYRVRALAHCAATAGLPPPQLRSSSAYLSDSVLPRVSLHRATADLQPLPPSDAVEGSQSRWSWLPYMGNESSSQMPDLAMQLEVEGEALEGLRQGRLLAYGSTWCPVRILEGCLPASGAPASRRTAGPAPPTHPAVTWLQTRLAKKEDKEASLLVEARLPGAIASQVCHAHTSGHEPALELHLRSDFAELTVPVSVRVPTVWLLGSSTAAARRLMLALSAASPTSRGGQHLSVQPAELTLDGAKWCNLLAAPVTTPGLALSALTAALPPSRIDGPGRTGPLRLSASLLQGLQAWLVGAQSSLREGASCSAIVLAMDATTALPKQQLSKLMLRAHQAGVGCIWVPIGGESAAVRSLSAAQKGALVVELEDVGGIAKPEALLGLRHAAFRALSGQPPPVSRL